MLFLAAVLLAMPLAVAGEIFQWTDPAGGIHFTHDLREVPADQRAAARERAQRSTPSRLQTFERAAVTPPAALGRQRGSIAGGEIRIPFRRQGTLMIVDVELNDAVTAPFLVDTGASAVAIPAALLDSLARLETTGRADLAPRIPVQTAGGVIEEALVRLDSVQLGPARVEQVDALVSSQMQVGLLGGNFFNNFVYSVDAAAGEITLRSNDQMRSGISAEQWRLRFAQLHEALEALDAQLALLEPHEGGALRERRARFAAALELLHGDANDARVPQAWR